MKKILLLIIATLCLTVLCGTTVTAFAETTEPTVTQDEIDTIIDKLEELSDSGELTAQLQQYLNKYENEDIQFFNQKILPIIISCGVLLLGGLVMVFPSIKKNSKYNKLVGYVTALEDKLKAYETTSETESQARQNFLTAFTEKADKVALDMNLFAKISRLEEENQAELEKIVSCLLHIVSEDADAVKLLTQTSSQKALEKDEKIIEQLKNVIRKISGETADDLINQAENV